MTLSESFCLERAEAAAAVAAASGLDNVRVQQLGAEATWRKMAAQARQLTSERAAREARKLAEAESDEAAAAPIEVD